MAVLAMAGPAVAVPASAADTPDIIIIGHRHLGIGNAANGGGGAATARAQQLEVCQGKTSDAEHCVVQAHTRGTVAATVVAGAPNMTCPCAKAPCPNPDCPCVAGSFGCPGFDPAFDLTGVQLAGNFGSNMILQRAPQRSAVYGTATPGTRWGGPWC